jgi:[ribosomal protein S5]-alanine N-acetyltransferase
MVEDDVRLRPVEDTDLALLERLDKEPLLSEPFEWTGFRSPANRRRRWEKDGYLGDQDALLVVALPDGTFTGIVVWKRTGGTASLGGCFEIGILLLPEYRGRGLGSAAQAVLAHYLFSTTLANRLEALTEADNTAEQRALERAGFVQEGTLRGRAFVRGAWRDGLMYSRLRSDPPPFEPR